MENIERVKKIAKVLDDKKAMDIKAMEIKELTIVADYFIIANGTSNTHVKALADEVEHEMSKDGIEPHHIEGRATGWILLDYGSIVVHVFLQESREYYNLERLWTDAKTIDLG
ncbi:MAG: ribosome silencing factor [Oscillospiraceae bacterium]|jgi:ribosome-associated protein|nr:ribosome silencing factor [Oscillospiraceae bacterium]